MYLIERLRKEQREWFEKERTARERNEGRLTLRLTLIGLILAILCMQPDSVGGRIFGWVWNLIRSLFT